MDNNRCHRSSRSVTFAELNDGNDSTTINDEKITPAPSRDHKRTILSSSSPPQSQTSSLPTTTTTAVTPATIVDEAQECLAQSNLMFLYADLRLLSATGRINTKFESLCIDSDRVPKTTSAEMAQLANLILPPNIEIQNNNCEGISPVQIMAILFVELRQEVLAQRRKVKEQLEKDKNKIKKGWVPTTSITSRLINSEVDEDDDDGLLNKITDRQGRKQLEMDMHHRLRAYNDMLSQDLKGMPEVKIENIVQNKFRRVNWFARSENESIISRNENDDDDDDENNNNNDFDEDNDGGSNKSISTAPGRFQFPSILTGRILSSPIIRRGHSIDELSAARIEACGNNDKDSCSVTPTKKYDDSSNGGGGRDRQQTTSSDLFPINETDGEELPSPKSTSDTPNRLFHSMPQTPKQVRGTAESRKELLMKQVTTYVARVKEDRALQHQFDDYEAFAGAEDIANKVLTMTSQINFAEHCPTGKLLPGEHGRNMSENELLDFMTKAIDNRDSQALDFMSAFFKDESVSQIMVKSEAKFVWLQDWYPIKDCIYAITVDTKTKRVLVVFRGAQTRSDWNHGFDAKSKRCDNPVKEQYVGKTDYLRIHRGFYDYLFRLRKDTLTTKYDEITTKVCEYGNKMIGSDFSVIVNGLSLGGGLGLLFGFFASTDERLTRISPVKVFTYGMPLMATNSFADAFRHQEMSRKVQHARFYNHNDVGECIITAVVVSTPTYLGQYVYNRYSLLFLRI